MAAVPDRPFMRKVLDSVFDLDHINRPFNDKPREVLKTTEPLMLRDLYANYKEKEETYLIPPKLVSPFCKKDVTDFVNKKNMDLVRRENKRR